MEQVGAREQRLIEQFNKRIDQLTQRLRDVEADKITQEVKEAYQKQELTSELRQAKELVEKVEMQNSRLIRENEDREGEAQRLRHETLALKSQLIEQEKNRETFMRELVRTSHHMSFKAKPSDDQESLDRMEPERDF